MLLYGSYYDLFNVRENQTFSNEYHISIVVCISVSEMGDTQTIIQTKLCFNKIKEHYAKGISIFLQDRMSFRPRSRSYMRFYDQLCQILTTFEKQMIRKSEKTICAI